MHRRPNGSPARQPRWGPRMQLEFHHELLTTTITQNSRNPQRNRLCSASSAVSALNVVPCGGVSYADTPAAARFP
jgi:hypothetical protein